MRESIALIRGHELAFVLLGALAFVAWLVPAVAVTLLLGDTVDARMAALALLLPFTIYRAVAAALAHHDLAAVAGRGRPDPDVAATFE